MSEYEFLDLFYRPLLLPCYHCMWWLGVKLHQVFVGNETLQVLWTIVEKEIAITVLWLMWRTWKSCIMLCHILCPIAVITIIITVVIIIMFVGRTLLLNILSIWRVWCGMLLQGWNMRSTYPSQSLSICRGRSVTFKTFKTCILDEWPLKPLKSHLGPLLTCFFYVVTCIFLIFIFSVLRVMFLRLSLQIIKAGF